MSTTGDLTSLDLPRLVEAVANGELAADEATVRILGRFHPSLENTTPEQLRRACRGIRAAAAAKALTVGEFLAAAS